MPLVFLEEFLHLKAILGADYRVNFAKNGDPNGPGLPEWKKYKSGESAVMDLGDQVLSKPGLYKPELMLIEGLNK